MNIRYRTIIELDLIQEIVLCVIRYSGCIIEQDIDDFTDLPVILVIRTHFFIQDQFDSITDLECITNRYSTSLRVCNMNLITFGCRKGQMTTKSTLEA